jgi:hypothetical protein
MLASPPCIVPGLVRGSIEAAAAQANLRASQRGAWRGRCGLMSIRTDGIFEGTIKDERSLPEGWKRFFKLFTESTFEGKKKYAKRQREITRSIFLCHHLCSLPLGDAVAKQSTS